MHAEPGIQLDIGMIERIVQDNMNEMHEPERSAIPE
jgi:hypothetical protein